MSSQHNDNIHRIALGTILIFVGMLFFLKTLDIVTFNVFSMIFSFPFIIFVIGVLILVNSRRKLFGILLTIAGAILLIPRFVPGVIVDSNIIFAIFIIGFGIAILTKKKDYNFSRGRFTNEKYDADLIDDVSIFSGGNKTVYSHNFKGGNVTAIFGGSKIDLSGCKLAEGNNIIDVATIFGGTTLIVPKDWNININVVPIFGGFSNKIRKDPSQPIDLTRTLTIKGIAIFGGGEIKSYYAGY